MSEATCEFQTVGVDSPHFESVMRLYRENKKILGFMPRGAFEERATNSKLLACVRESRVMGYLIFRVDLSMKISLDHLCVDSDCRRQGIAKSLVSALRKRTQHCRGIGLLCRRDFGLDVLWKRLGFVATKEVTGRAGQKTFFWREYDRPGLFTDAGDDSEDTRICAVIDANVFFDLIDPTRKEADESQGLEADWIENDLKLQVTQELFNDVDANPDQEEREERRRQIRAFSMVEALHDDFDRINDEIQVLLPAPRNAQTEADYRQLSWAIASSADAFVTRDVELHKLDETIDERYSVRIVRPSELISSIDEVRRRKSYRPRRVKGTAVFSQQKVSTDADALSALICRSDKGEAKNEVRRILNSVFANPDDSECRVVTDAGGAILCAVVAHQKERAVEISMLRLTSSVRKSRLASLLFRSLILQTVEQATSNGNTTIVFKDRITGREFADDLSRHGFIPNGEIWYRLVVPQIRTVESLPSIIDESAVELGDAREVMAIHIDANAENASSVLKTESTLWPLKLRNTCVANFIVPIRASWAEHLFDEGMAKDSLFGADPDLALNPDSVYYRNPRQRILTNEGRILWYVSEDGKRSGTKCIRAVSRLTSVTVAPPKEVFRKFSRFGVFGWGDVVSAVCKESQLVMAAEFTDTELFECSVSHQAAQQILSNHGKDFSFVSPRKISDDIFFQIYEAGFPSRNC